MLLFIVRRTLLAVLTVWALSVISFIIIQLPPGDYLDQYVEKLFGGGGEYGGQILGAKGSPFEAALRHQ